MVYIPSKSRAIMIGFSFKTFLVLGSSQSHNFTCVQKAECGVGRIVKVNNTCTAECQWKLCKKVGRKGQGLHLSGSSQSALSKAPHGPSDLTILLQFIPPLVSFSPQTFPCAAPGIWYWEPCSLSPPSNTFRGRDSALFCIWQSPTARNKHYSITSILSICTHQRDPMQTF